MPVYFRKVYNFYGEIEKEGSLEKYSFPINMAEFENARLELQMNLQEKKLTVVTHLDI